MHLFGYNWCSQSSRDDFTFQVPDHHINSIQQYPGEVLGVVEIIDDITIGDILEIYIYIYMSTEVSIESLYYMQYDLI
jgi:hypothetical protein